MPNTLRRSVWLLFAVLPVLTYHLVTVVGQVSTPSGNRGSVAKAAASWTPPRTPDGKPDLQGVWNKNTGVPLQRDPALGLKASFTDAEAREYHEKRVEARHKQIAGVHYDDSIWLAPADDLEKVPVDMRTSIITDPPNGRIPPLTPAAEKRVKERSIGLSYMPSEGPEVRTALERCIIWPQQGPPMLPNGSPEINYNANLEIAQTRENIVVYQEMVHDARVIPLDGRPHFPEQVRQWLGDSRGRWEGDTLVVDTTNFTDRIYNIRRTNSPSLDAFHTRGPDSKLHVVERFTLVGPDTLRYQFTVEDPMTWTQRWSGEYLMWRAKGPLHEYACSEGNYGLPNILGNERALERKAQENKR